MSEKYKGVVLYPPTIDYSVLYQRPQQIARQFALNGYKVIFCNHTQTKRPMQEVEKNLFVNYDFQSLLKDISKGKLKIDIYYFSWGLTTQYIDAIKAKLVIFDSLDIFEVWKEAEKEAIKKADIVLTTSQYIYDVRTKEHSYVHLVRNACDSRLISEDYTSPEDMKEFDAPVGMVGAMGEWVLTSMMKKVATHHDSVFIGKELPKRCPSNVLNLGHKDHGLLINYYKSLSVGLIPFNTKMEVIQACNPIKMYEYMGCGIPIVSTAWRETEQFGDLVLTSDVSDSDSFLKNVSLAKELRNDKKYTDRLKKMAQRNTWEERFKIIETAIKGWEPK